MAFSQPTPLTKTTELGKLEKDIIHHKTELKVDQKFETELTFITSIIPGPDKTLWISDWVSGIFQNVKQDGDELSVISNFDTKLLGASFLPWGDLLLSNDLSNLKLIPSGSTDIQDSVYTVSPLLTTGVHVTCDNKVIVGAVDSNDFSETKSRQVIVMDQTGQHEKIFQFDRHNKPLFTSPWHLTSNSQGDIAVVDTAFDDEETGKVVVLDQQGEVRNIYTGHPDKDKPFYPTDITATPSDNFVVADINNDSLHILNSEGKIITFFDTMEIGIVKPFSLSFSTTRQLYIVCASEEGKATIFKVDHFYF